MDIDAVLARFCSMARLDPEDADAHRWLAEAAVSQAEALLRPGADPQAPPLTDLAAAFALYRFALLQEDGGRETVRALDVSVSRDGGTLLKHAAVLRQDALVQAVPFLRDTAFSFLPSSSAPGPVEREFKGGALL